VKAFTEVLRIELEEARLPISVSLVKPGGIATPMPQHMKNYMEVEGTWAPPVYDPQSAAEGILHCATHQVRDMRIGSSSRTVSMFEAAAPRLLDRFIEKFLFRAQEIPVPRRYDGDNLHQAGMDGLEQGWFPTRSVRPSLYTKAVTHPAATAAILLGAALVVTILLRID
jgi:hypothetical protein